MWIETVLALIGIRIFYHPDAIIVYNHGDTMVFPPFCNLQTIVRDMIDDPYFLTTFQWNFIWENL